MRLLLCFVLLSCCTSQRVRACDICGSSGNQYLGILPQFYRHFIGAQYQYRSFESSHPSVFAGKPDEQSKEYYNTLQVWGRYYIGNSIQLFGFVPYHTNIREAAGGSTTSRGLGDMSVIGNAVLLRADSSHYTWKQTLLAGGGVKLPTGKYSGTTVLDRQGLPNMQAGSGSWDFLINTNYTIRHQSAGINVDVAYTLTTTTKDMYKYGNRLNTGLLGFYWLYAGSVSLLPQLGMRYEYALHDYDNYGKKWLNTQTGGYQCFGAVGLQAYYRRLGFQTMLNIPVSQHYSAGYTSAKRRLETGIFLLF